MDFFILFTRNDVKDATMFNAYNITRTKVGST